MKILLLEDETALNKAIKTYLEKKGHEVHSFLSGDEALEQIEKINYDTYVLDINTPGKTGMEALEYINSTKLDPIVVMITAYDDIQTLSSAYSRGCSEYIKKPFSLKELEIRFEKICQYKHFSAGTISLNENIKYNFAKDELIVNEKEIIMSKNEKAMVKFFFKHINKIVSTDELKLSIWSDYVEDSTLRTLLNRVRKKLGQEYIESIHGVGYKLIAKYH